MSIHIFSTEEDLQLKNAYFIEVPSEQQAGFYRQKSLHRHRNRHVIKNCSLHNLFHTIPISTSQLSNALTEQNASAVIILFVHYD
jgi:hypothetical protein